jgi:hypothetical protein
MVRKNALKKKPKLPPRRRIIQSKRKKTTLAIFGILIVFLAGGLLYKKHLENQDLNRFTDAKFTQREISSNVIASTTGNVASLSNSDECFKAGQGPYDTGKLWCQTATIVKLKQDVNFSELGKTIIKSARTKELMAGYNNDDYWFRTAQGIDCKYRVKTANRDLLGSVTNDTLYSIEGPAFTIACADRAKAKHYPFVY